MKAHFQMLAAYNRWANRRLFAAAAELPADAPDRDLGAYFGSVLGTLNHLLVADLIWLARFEGAGPPKLALDQRLYDSIETLAVARGELDSRIAAHVAALDERAYAWPLVYHNMAGDRFEQPRGEILAHFFNHQTHHRGQVHALMTRLAGTAPPLDLIHFLREGPVRRVS